MGREQHCKQITVACSRSVLATLGLPPITAYVLSLSTLLRPLGCYAENCLRPALGCMHFRGLSCSGSATWVLHKVTDSVGPAFCALPRSKQLRWPGAWQARLLQLIASRVPAAWFSGCTTGVPSQVCRVSLLGSWSLAVTLLADVNHPESQEVLVSNEACLQFGRWHLSGAAIAPFWLWLPSPACLCQGICWPTAS